MSHVVHATTVSAIMHCNARSDYYASDMSTFQHGSDPYTCMFDHTQTAQVLSVICSDLNILLTAFFAC